MVGATATLSFGASAMPAQRCVTLWRRSSRGLPRIRRASRSSRKASSQRRDPLRPVGAFEAHS